MAWIDDRIWCHPKLADISDREFRVWVNSLAYSAGLGTRGRLTPGQQKLVGSTPRVQKKLVETGLWDAAGDDVLIHDWDAHNGKRDERREADRERKRRARSAGQSAGTSAGQSAGQSTGRARGASTGTARVEGSEGSEGSDKSKKPLAAAPQERPRDLVWDTLVQHFGEPLTASERSKRNGAAKQLRDAGATPEQITAAVRSWPKQYPDATCTPHALVNHWGQLRMVSRSPQERFAEHARRVEGDAA